MELYRITVVGVFDDPGMAERAVDELQRAGFGLPQISLSSRHTDTGARGRSGGFLEGLKRLFAGDLTDTDVAPSDVKGDLKDMGLSEDAARYYEDQYKHGRSVIAVRAENRANDALDVLRANGGHDFDTRPNRDQPPAVGRESGAPVPTGAETPPIMERPTASRQPDMTQQPNAPRPPDTARRDVPPSPPNQPPAADQQRVSPTQQAYQEQAERFNKTPEHAQTADQPSRDREGSAPTDQPQTLNPIDEQRIRERREQGESEGA